MKTIQDRDRICCMENNNEEYFKDKANEVLGILIEREIISDKTLPSVNLTIKRDNDGKAVTADSINPVFDENFKKILMGTHFGGLVYWTPDGKKIYDHSKDVLYPLIQIDFSEVPHIEDYPTKGLLQIFIGGDDLMGLFKGTNRGYKVVYTENPPKYIEINEKNVVSVTDGLLKDSPFSKPELMYALEGSLIDCHPPVDDGKIIDLVYSLFTNDEAEEIPKIVLDEISKKYKMKDEEIHIGGYPLFTQNDPREDDGSYKFDDGEAIVLDRLLVQMDSMTSCEDPSYPIMWGDTGVGNLFINGDALKRNDYNHVLYNWDCA